MRLRHSLKTPIKDAKGKVIKCTTQCGITTENWKDVDKAASFMKVTCAECILALMTTYENKICMLESRYQELFPNRPVGEKLQ